MSERVALVTGASRGIGAAIALSLVEQQLFVVGTATTDEGAHSIAETLGASGTGVALRIDSAESVTETVKRITTEYGAPVVLVNNAGITRDNLLMRTQESEWNAVLDTNLGGTYRVTKAVLRGMMKARWGRIVNLSSVVARRGNAGQANYAASKAGIEGFTRALALEVASRNVTVNAVAPGFIDTDMTAELADEQRSALETQIPLGRIGTCDEVAATVSFLASDAAAYITGETISVNGGMLMC